MFAIKRYWRLVSDNSIKLLPIKVKKVKNPTDNVTTKIIAINIFTFKNLRFGVYSYMNPIHLNKILSRVVDIK